MMARGKQCASRSTITPTKTCSADHYRRIKRSTRLNEHTARGIWSFPESKLQINYLELKAVFLALKVFQDLCENSIVLIATDNTTVVAYINRGWGWGWGVEAGPSVCPSSENRDLVFQKIGYSQSPTHSRPVECGSRQAIQTRPDHSNRMGTPPGGLPSNMQKVAPASYRPVCNQVQQETGQICVTSAGHTGLGSRCTQPFMGGSGPTCLPTSSYLGQSGGEVAGPSMSKNHSDCPQVIQHALVLGSSGHVQPNTTDCQTCPTCSLSHSVRLLTGICQT